MTSQPVWARDVLRYLLSEHQVIYALCVHRTRSRITEHYKLLVFKDGIQDATETICKALRWPTFDSERATFVTSTLRSTALLCLPSKILDAPIVILK